MIEQKEKLKKIFDYFQPLCTSEKIFPGVFIDYKPILIDAYWVSKLNNNWRVCIFIYNSWNYLEFYDDIIDEIFDLITNDNG